MFMVFLDNIIKNSFRGALRTRQTSKTELFAKTLYSLKLFWQKAPS